jgi:flagellin
MGLRVNNNIAAMNAYRNLTTTEGQMSKSLEKLSSGFRINRAADDAAGLAISEQLRSQVGGLKVAQRNAQDGISVIQTAEGALTETHALLQRVRDLSVQAANLGANSEEARKAAASEVEQALAEIDRISKATKFGGTQLLDGNGGVGAKTFSFQVGSEAAAVNQVSVSINAMNSTGLSLDASKTPATNGSIAFTYADTDATAADIQLAASEIGFTLNGESRTVKVAAGTYTAAQLATAVNNALSSYGDVTATVDPATTTVKIEAKVAGLKQGDFEPVSNSGGFGAGTATDGTGEVSVATLVTAGHRNALNRADVAIKAVSEQRGALGASQNRLEHTIANLAVTTENLSASESRIRDTDMAQEMTNYTRSQILVQAGTAMLAQANSSTQSVLSLLRG